MHLANERIFDALYKLGTELEQKKPLWRTRTSLDDFWTTLISIALSRQMYDVHNQIKLTTPSIKDSQTKQMNMLLLKALDLPKAQLKIFQQLTSSSVTPCQLVTELLEIFYGNNVLSGMATIYKNN
jgi:hypothetical protein